MDTKSSTQELGRYVTQIRHFVGGTKRTFHGIDTQSIKDGSFCKMRTKDGRMLMVNSDNVLMVEVFAEAEGRGQITQSSKGDTISLVSTGCGTHLNNPDNFCTHTLTQ